MVVLNILFKQILHMTTDSTWIQVNLEVVLHLITCQIVLLSTTILANNIRLIIPVRMVMFNQVTLWFKVASLVVDRALSKIITILFLEVLTTAVSMGYHKHRCWKLLKEHIWIDYSNNNSISNRKLERRERTMLNVQESLPLLQIKRNYRLT